MKLREILFGEGAIGDAIAVLCLVIAITAMLLLL